MNSIITHARIRQIYALTIILVLFFFLVFSLKDLFTAFLGALIFYVLFRKFMLRLINEYKWKRWSAASVIIVISILVIVIPLSSLIYLLFGKVQELFSNPDALLAMYHNLLDRINGIAGRNVFDSNSVTDFGKKLAGMVPSLLNTSLNLFGSLVIMYFFLFNLLVNTGTVEKILFQILPFDNKGIKLLTSEMHSMTYSNAIAVPLIAACQGLVASLGFLIFGLDSPFFWGIMCGCTSIIPVVGAGLIWIPAGLYLLSTAEPWRGIGILIYGAVVISLIDNVFRFFFAKWFADVHPVITILGVIVGLQWFGLPGLVFGPLLISYFFLLLIIYKKEFVDEAENTI